MYASYVFSRSVAAEKQKCEEISKGVWNHQKTAGKAVQQFFHRPG